MTRPRTWSDDDNTRLMQLVADNVPREEIAQRLRKTRQQISTQICKIRIRRDLRDLRAEASGIAAADQPTNHGVLWTPEEIERVLSLGRTACLADWPAIAREHFPGRTAKACKQQYYVHRRAALGVAPRTPSRPQDKQKVDPRPTKVPAAAKPAPAPQSLTAAIMGDPPPGRSALDQRQQFSSPRGIS